MKAKSINPTELSAELLKINAELAELKTEHDFLHYSPLAFDDFCQVVIDTVDRTADEIPHRLRTALMQEASQNGGVGIRKNGEGRYASVLSTGAVSEASNWSPLRLNRWRPGDNDAAGLDLAFVLFLLRDKVKTELPAMLEPLRVEWPDASECGPSPVVRRKRLSEIAKREAELTSQRAEYAAMARAISEAIDGAASNAIPLPEGVRMRA